MIHTYPTKHLASILRLLFGSALAFQSLHAYTLEEALTTAMQNSAAMLEAEKTLEDARSKVKQAYGTALPTVKLVGKYEKAFDQYDMFGGASSSNTNPFQNSGPYLDQNNPSYDPAVSALVQDLGAMLDFSGLVRDYQSTVSLQVEQILYAQGKVYTAVEIAKDYESLSEARHAQTRRQVQLDVTQAFHQVLYFTEAVELYDSSIVQANRQLSQVSAMYKSGLVGELDFLRAELQVKELSSGKDKMGKDLLLAKNALLAKMGMPWDPQATFSGTLQDPQDGTPFPDTSLTNAMERRLEVKQVEAMGSIQNHLIRIANADYLPAIVAGGSISKISQSNSWNDFAWQDDQRVYVAMSWNLFEGGQTRQRVVQAKTEAAKVKIQRLDLERGIKLQIESETAAVNDARQRVAVRMEMVDLADRSLKMVETAYAAGRATQLEVLAASLDARKSRLGKLEALLDYHNALHRLRHATADFQGSTP